MEHKIINVDEGNGVYNALSCVIHSYIYIYLSMYKA